MLAKDLCNLCGDNKKVFNPDNYPPVCYFGDPAGKEIMVIGLNPSIREFKERYVTYSPAMDSEEYRRKLAHYFDGNYYRGFFDAKLLPFFEDGVKKRLGWQKTPWEKVSHLDIVKCPFEDGWAETPQQIREVAKFNCAQYMSKQLRKYRPRLLLLYGAQVLGMILNIGWDKKEVDRPVIDEGFDDRVMGGNFSSFKLVRDGVATYALSVNQVQGRAGHSKAEVIYVRKWLLEKMDATGLFMEKKSDD